MRFQKTTNFSELQIFLHPKTLWTVGQCLSDFVTVFFYVSLTYFSDPPPSWLTDVRTILRRGSSCLDTLMSDFRWPGLFVHNNIELHSYGWKLRLCLRSLVLLLNKDDKRTWSDADLLWLFLELWNCINNSKRKQHKLSGQWTAKDHRWSLVSFHFQQRNGVNLKIL